MKKMILISMLMMAVLVVFGQDPAPIEEPSGFWKFYNQYSEAIWAVLGASGAFALLWPRLAALRDAVGVLLVAGDDNSPEGRKVTQSEWDGIVLAFKAIWKPKVEDIKEEVRKINSK